MRTPEEMYKAITDWEMNAGEDFCDYFESSVNEYNLLFWALGKGHLTADDIKAYEQRDNYSSLTDIVIGNEPYSITKYDEESHNDLYVKAYKIFAEFLASSVTYQKRVDNFINNIHKIKLEDITRNLFKERVFFIHNGERVYVKGIEDVVQVPIGRLLSTQWYVDNNELEDEK